MHINTQWGWRFLHKENHRRAKIWVQDGRNVDEQKARMEKVGDYFVTETNFREYETKKRLLVSARHRAMKAGIPFCINIDHVEIPKLCPLRRVPFQVGYKILCDDSPSLDRKDPRRGYVPGNVWVISHKANRLKGDFTPEELRVFCERLLDLDWITWTNDDEERRQELELEHRRKLNEQHKWRWWQLFGRGPPSANIPPPASST